MDVVQKFDKYINVLKRIIWRKVLKCLYVVTKNYRRLREANKQFCDRITENHKIIIYRVLFDLKLAEIEQPNQMILYLKKHCFQQLLRIALKKIRKLPSMAYYVVVI